MTDEKMVETLRSMEFFREFDDEHLGKLAEISQITEYRARATIFREKEVATDVYFVIDGRVSLVVCEPDVGCRVLMEVGPGDMIGWSPLVGRSRLSDTAHTLTVASVVSIQGDRLRTLCAECPQLGYEFMRRAAEELAKRLTATRLRMMQMTGRALPEIQIESD